MQWLEFQSQSLIISSCAQDLSDEMTEMRIPPAMAAPLLTAAQIEEFKEQYAPSSARPSLVPPRRAADAAALIALVSSAPQPNAGAASSPAA